ASSPCHHRPCATGEDDAAWERAISAAIKSTSAPKTLTLDGVVKSSTGGLPSAALLERFAASLEELSVAGRASSRSRAFPASRRFGASPSPPSVAGAAHTLPGSAPPAARPLPATLPGAAPPS
uniref:Uncharacterized protein n=1 Tax=Zea mays TaxID=4577 RepID=A0A804Q468_MAIZE